MKPKNTLFFVLIIISSCIFAQEESTETKYGVFSFDKEVTLPGIPEEIFDAVTGDISGWWDHSVSEDPLEFYIDPVPGGGFWEIFDEEGNGILHATVTAADRGKLLRFDGPLGLAGKAIHLVTTYTFEIVGEDSTLLKVSIHAAGEIAEGVPELVESVWDHFIFERLKPYVEDEYDIIK